MMYSEHAVTELVQYQFADAEDGGTWRLGSVSSAPLANYIGVKLQLWEKTLASPTCEAEFRRMIQNGVVTNIFDTEIFPTPEALKCNYEVTDTKTGKVLIIPHPVDDKCETKKKNKNQS